MEGRWSGSDCVSFPSSRKMMTQSWHAFQVHKVPGLPLGEEQRPGAESNTICCQSQLCSKATWECPLVTKFKAVTQSLSFLSCSKTPSSLLLLGLSLQWHPEGFEYSTMLATGCSGLTCLRLAVHLLELEALIAVAVALDVAKVIAGGGPAALLGGLFGSRLGPVPALHAELLTAAGQDVLAGGPGALGPGGALRGSRHVSALAHSQLLFSPFCFTKSLILSFNETLLTVSFKRGASQGATFPS